MNKNDLIESLNNQNRLLNIDIIENLKHEEIELIYMYDKGCLIENQGTQLISFEDKSKIKNFDEKIDKSKIIVVHQEFYKEHLIKNGYTVLSSCHQATFEKSSFCLDLPNDVVIKYLTLNNLDFVFSLYNKFIDRDGLKERIQNKKMFGIFYQGKIAGFIGWHHEGAIGMLEIDKEFRRRHFATYLEKFIINKQLEELKTPYCQIIDGNEKSMSLQKKLGFSFAKEMIFWMKKL